MAHKVFIKRLKENRIFDRLNPHGHARGKYLLIIEENGALYAQQIGEYSSLKYSYNRFKTNITNVYYGCEVEFKPDGTCWKVNDR